MESKEDDLIYILIPFIGAFLILLSMCCYEKKSSQEEPQGDLPVTRGATSIEMLPMMNTGSHDDSEGGGLTMVSDFNAEMVAADEGVCIDVQSVADDTNHSNSTTSGSLDYVAAERQDGQDGQDRQSMSESMDSAMIIVHMDSADDVSSLPEVDR